MLNPVTFRLAPCHVSHQAANPITSCLPISQQSITWTCGHVANKSKNELARGWSIRTQMNEQVVSIQHHTYACTRMHTHAHTHTHTHAHTLHGHKHTRACTTTHTKHVHKHNTQRHSTQQTHAPTQNCLRSCLRMLVYPWRSRRQMEPYAPMRPPLKTIILHKNAHKC